MLIQLKREKQKQEDAETSKEALSSNDMCEKSKSLIETNLTPPKSLPVSPDVNPKPARFISCEIPAIASYSDFESGDGKFNIYIKNISS